MRRRIAVAALALLAACGKPPPEHAAGMEQLYPLRRLLNEIDAAVEGTLVEVDRDRLVAVLKIGHTLKGACPHTRLLLNLEGGFTPYRDLIRRQLVENAPVVFLYANSTGLLYLNRVFHYGYLDAGAPPDKAAWTSSNIEHRLNRTYNGSVESLAALIASEAVPPAPQTDLPPIDTPALLALPLPGEAVDEEYLPAPFRRKAPPPPVLRAPENPAKVVDGLHLDYFEGITSDRLDFDTLKPGKTDVAPRLDLYGHAAANRYALRFRGYVDIPKDGEYSFFLRTEGDAELRIGDASVAGKDREAAVDVALKAGRHAIRLTYLGFGGEKALQVFWAGPGFAKRPLPPTAFRR